ncbi:hypothetical protein [Stenotrophomonas sp. NPDC077659]|uniref:hypothetical protein n=1 Tax=Stenotrophomonas sp. NPDC077659 TaxID=3390694 RepID=UPI003CFF95BF
MSPLASLGTVCGAQRTSSLCDAPVSSPAPDHRRKAALDGHCQTKIVIDFALWVTTRCNNFPTVQQVQDRFNVSRATAFRWRRSLADALGMSDMPRNPIPGRAPEPLPLAPLLRGAGDRA